MTSYKSRFGTKFTHLSNPSLGRSQSPCIMPLSLG